MKHHDGKIGVKSSGINGEGALFYIELPATLMTTRIVEQQQSQQQQQQQNPPNQQYLQSTNVILTSQLNPHEINFSSHNQNECVHSYDEVEGNHSYSYAHVHSDDENEPVSQIIVTPHSVTGDKFFEDFTDRMLTNIKPKKLYHRTLVVDDSKLNRKMLIAAVDKFFDTIDQVENGELAVQMVKEMWSQNIYYDIIFMDNLMPVMNGGQAARLIRQFGYNNPIIGVTGNIMENDVQNFLEMGATIVIGKPVTIEGLEKNLLGK